MKTELENILSAIVAAEHEAAALIMHAHGIMAEIKTGHRDVVTEYDRRVQALLVARLREAVPGARFFCEESRVQEELSAAQAFVIDPIDGTMNFVRRMHHSCISVAYMSFGTVMAAAVYDPYTDELFTALRGGGAYLNGRALHVEDAPLSETVFCLGTSPYDASLTDETFRLARLAYDASLDLRRFASAELDLCAVAAGRAGLYFELSLSLWDYAAGALIVTEASGVCTAVDGAPLSFGSGKSSVAAGSPHAHADFMALVKKEGE